MEQPELQFDVKGMTCNHCVQAIEREVATIDGVVAARVDLAAQKLFVTGHPKDGLIQAAVRSIGYEANGN